ncbi:AraC family transcriptional regulator [Paenibacillus sp. LMG 31456]|uniref:AraC family transcriptional regulator n=1 Tax=Paenibacillus foliorum TaxID=2654974 RepID=A0A972GP92_9BACL|nr:GyrI-like domain-containing protein [Paenibacillus foliorum]NOU93635.1 AraC family transcriptional regulator [Paenibacillus foliorum]
MSIELVKLESKEAFTVIGIQCPLSPIEAPKVWHSFIQNIHLIENRVQSTVSLGVCDDLNQRYIASVEVDKVDVVPEGMVSLEIPANEYAVFKHKGSIQGINESFQEIGRWLHQNNYKGTHKPPFFELYDERYQGESEESEFTIYMSLVKI